MYKNEIVGVIFKNFVDFYLEFVVIIQDDISRL